MLKQKKLLNMLMIATLSLASVGSKAAPPPWVKGLVPEAQMVGQERFHFFFIKVYDAALYAPGGTWKSSEPYALSLTYLRDFKGKAIAKKSIEEISNQGFKNQQKLDAWLKAMENLFPDVQSGETLTGIRTAKESARFYLGEQHIGDIDDAEFSDRFFGIWLKPETSDPKFRKALLGE